MNRDDAFLLAINVAKDVYNYNSRHGAVIIDSNGEVISIGRNMKKWNPRNYIHGYPTPYDHAEANAIFKALNNPTLIRRLNGSTLVVVRLGKTKLKNSYPCENCIELSKLVGISIIYYSTENGGIGALGL